MRAQGAVEKYYFSGAKAMSGTLSNTAVVDRTSSYDSSFYRAVGGVVDIGISTHGYIAGSGNPPRPNLIYLQGTTNYEGLRKIVSIPDANTVRIVADYVAETPNGKAFFPGVSFDQPFRLVGFELHLSAADTTSENLTITKDSYHSSSFDANLFTEDMNSVQDYVKNFDNDPEMVFDSDDVVKFAFANANSLTWGLLIKAQRLY